MWNRQNDPNLSLFVKSKCVFFACGILSLTVLQTSTLPEWPPCFLAFYARGDGAAFLFRTIMYGGFVFRWQLAVSPLESFPPLTQFVVEHQYPPVWHLPVHRPHLYLHIYHPITISLPVAALLFVTGVSSSDVTFKFLSPSSEQLRRRTQLLDVVRSPSTWDCFCYWFG